jgi:hypothetical protein
VGRTRLRGVELGGVRLAIEVPHAFSWRWPVTWMPELACSPHDPDVYVGVRVGVVSVPRFDAIVYSCEGGSFEIGRVGRDWVVVVHGRERFERVARFDSGFREGEVVISPRALSLGAQGLEHPLQHPLDDLIVMHRVARDGGLVVRGSALLRRGLALVFLGTGAPPVDLPSGWSGAKSTSRLLARDRVVLQVDQDGIRAHGTPWRGSAGDHTPTSACLEALYVVRSSRNGVAAQRLDLERALRELLSQSFAPVHDPESVERQLRAARSIVERVPLLVMERPKRREEEAIAFAWGHRQAALGLAPPAVD